MIYMCLNKISAGYKVAFWVILLVALDQLVKMLIHFNLEVGEKIEVFSWFNLYYVENNGFAFGMQLGSGDGAIDWGKLVLSIFRIVMIGGLIYGIRYLLQRRDTTPVGVIAGAAFYNPRSQGGESLEEGARHPSRRSCRSHRCLFLQEP